MKIISLNKGSFAFILGLLLWCCPTRANTLKSFGSNLFLQQSISGTITDSAGSLPGVTIGVKGTQLYAVTDANGHFTITANPSDVLVISFIGYKTVEITVGSQSTFTIRLEEDSKSLAEVVINAGYYTVKDKERTGSIARITSKDIESQPVTNVLATMQGRMAGVSVTQETGVPGGGFTVQIRGQNSLRQDGNNPLYIINGVPYASDDIGAGVVGTVIPGQKSPLNSINPADIESIEVLKDADATAIYGSRGANGVVLITTKTGKAGKTAFSSGFSTGVAKVSRRIKLMDTPQYLQMRREAFQNDGVPYGPADYDVNGTWDQNRYTDWQDVFIGGTAFYNDMQGSISGGSDRTQFLISGNYHKETTVFPGDYFYRKSNVMANISHRSEDDRFRLNVSAGYAMQDNYQPGTDLTLQAAQLAPNAPALYDDQGYLNWENSTWTNPMSAAASEYKANTNDLIANAVLSYEIAHGLTLKSSMGFTDTRFDDSVTSPSTMYDPAYGLTGAYSTVYVNTTSRQSWIIEPQLDWKKDFGKGRLDLLVGSTFQQRNNEQLVQNVTGFSSNSLIYNLSAASYLFTLQDAETLYRYQALFGRLNFNWDGKYIINLTGRRDGSSRFGPGKQYANFGAVGASYIFSREEVVQDLEFLSFGKIRASYGVSGNDQIGDYQFLNTYALSGQAYGGVNGIAPTMLYNPDFGWESNKKLEIALEAGFFKDRIFLTAAGFRNRSSNQLVGIPLPGTTGFPSIQANLDAEVQNKGLELSLNTVNFETKDFKWNTNFNITWIRNKLLSFPGLEGSTYSNTYVIGQPLNITRLYHFEGVDPQTGIYRFKDYNGDGAITAEEDKESIADLNPDFFGGLQNTLSYKGWQLDFLFQFVKQQNFNGIYGLGLPGTMVNQSTEILQRWQQPGDSGQNQRYTTGFDAEAQDAYYKFLGSDGSLTDTSFLRLKNISLSYTLPQDWIKGVQCRITAQGQNVFVITPFKGADPEAMVSNRLPPLRVFTAGMQFNF